MKMTFLHLFQLGFVKFHSAKLTFVGVGSFFTDTILIRRQCDLYLVLNFSSDTTLLYSVRKNLNASSTSILSNLDKVFTNLTIEIKFDSTYI